MGNPAVDTPVEVPDLSEFSLHDVERLDDSALNVLLRELLDPAVRDGAAAGFGSFVEPAPLPADG